MSLAAPSPGRPPTTPGGSSASLPPGGSTTIGFQANHTGNNTAPTGFTLNGATCS
ncbi:cellulose binding domain-containing protein [Paractinoplanes durhamensis]|uniref:CBM2 domain-containing protein n=1 Tax=Paractinoplanes durhamensis TaxID=113563 RepID=A0ABQ3YR97_9ACTN|nr:cellulose binding domain-containing protein [Actinoplanes durhamensis]GIE00066.1 hypothetical protein Adu01nite_14160 [Actinoplanes durhamensis]